MENEVPKNPRLIDIARLAKVSIGTVDRVIHNRGRVSEETKERVNQAIASINYKPNVAAQILSIRKKRIVGGLVPCFTVGDYWAEVEKGIARAESEMLDYGFVIERFHFDRNNLEDFKKQIEIIKRRDDICGLLISPQYKECSVDFANYLSAKEIPFIYIDSNIEGMNQLSYYGIHSSRAGYILAKLMSDLLKKEDILIVNFHQNEDRKATQVDIIDAGFTDYLNQNNYQGKLYTIDIVLSNKNWREGLKDYIDKHPNIRGMVVFNSLAYKLAMFTEEHQLSDLIIGGFDLIERNIEYQQKGYIRYLLHQRPDSQGYLGLRALCHFIAFSTPVSEINLMPVDIIIAENVEFYLHFGE